MHGGTGKFPAFILNFRFSPFERFDEKMGTSIFFYCTEFRFCCFFSFGGRGASAGVPGHPVSSLLASNAIKVKGRQLLDQEGLSCLLIILFIDDPKINTTR